MPQSIKLFAQPGAVYKPISDFRELVHLALAHRKREAAPAVKSFLAVASKLWVH